MLHHVLKELASKRLPMDQRNFAEVSTWKCGCPSQGARQAGMACVAHLRM